MNNLVESDFIPEGMVILGVHLGITNPHWGCTCGDCKDVKNFFEQEVLHLKDREMGYVYQYTGEKKDRIVMSKHIYQTISHILASHIELLIVGKQYDQLQEVLQLLVAYKIPQPSIKM